MGQSMSKMTRISESTARIVDEIAKESSHSKQSVIEKAVELFYREFFLKRANQEYLKLKKDRAAWNESERELDEFDTTLLDGLDIYE